ncbi:hypothetical protein [Alkalicoccus chagannorensis]|uniref:hypothetical protein n=1 Tax=Alkalicoccus chagannorensis TaxID=427072 RepID=UPI00040B0338|nr:hypothetical protein [Alkalicoccus chagannorensis]
MKHREPWKHLQQLPRDPKAKEATWKKIEARLGEPEQRRRPTFWIAAAGAAATLILAVLLMGQFPSTEQQATLVEMDHVDDVDHVAWEEGAGDGSDYLLERYTEFTRSSDDTEVMERLLLPLIEEADPITDDVSFEPDMHLLAAEAEQEGTLIYLDLSSEANYASLADSNEVFELPDGYGTEVKQLYEFRADLEPDSASIVLFEDRDSVFLAQERAELPVPAGDALRDLHHHLMTTEAAWMDAEEAELPEEAEEAMLRIEMASMNYQYDVAWTGETFVIELSDGTLLEYKDEHVMRSWQQVKEATGHME